MYAYRYVYNTYLQECVHECAYTYMFREVGREGERRKGWEGGREERKERKTETGKKRGREREVDTDRQRQRGDKQAKS